MKPEYLKSQQKTNFYFHVAHQCACKPYAGVGYNLLLQNITRVNIWWPGILNQALKTSAPRLSAKMNNGTEVLFRQIAGALSPKN
jgi:hypothetical protein